MVISKYHSAFVSKFYKGNFVLMNDSTSIQASELHLLLKWMKNKIEHISLETKGSYVVISKRQKG